MTTQTEWEEVVIPGGNFIGWGTKAGQHVTGKIVSVTLTGGRDFNGEPCPEMMVELTEKAASFNKAGDRTEYPVGTMVTVTGGLANLRSNMERVKPVPLAEGQEIKLTMTGLEKSQSSGFEYKAFKLARNPKTVKPVSENRFEPVEQDGDAPPF